MSASEPASTKDQLLERIAGLEEKVSALESRERDYQQLVEEIARLERRPPGPEDRISICCFSGELDRMIAAFVIATGAAAMGSHVDLFFTFWGTSALRNPKARVKKSFIGRVWGWFLPTGHRKLKLSQMNFGGAGPVVIKQIMKKNNVASLEEMLELSAELGVRISICCMSMDLMGMEREEFIDYPDLRFCGVAQFLADSGRGHTTLFI